MNKPFTDFEQMALDATASHGLPTPRLQLTWMMLPEQHGGTGRWDTRQCLYTLVLPLRKHDIRGERTNNLGFREPGLASELHASLGGTRLTGGGRPVQDGIVSVPFRDGAHIEWDSQVLGNMPAFAICEHVVTRLEIQIEP